MQPLSLLAHSITNPPKMGEDESDRRFSYGDDPGYTNLTDYAWYDHSSGYTTHPVGQKLPNPWGLYDMHGNVFEWCQDWYGTYLGGSVTDPQGPATGSERVSRGGCWRGYPGYCRSANRYDYVSPAGRNSASLVKVINPQHGRTGFRFLLAPGQP